MTETQMARMLSVLNGGEVARRLGVSRTAVSEWSRLPDPPPSRVHQVRSLMLDALGMTEEPPPDWGRLMRTVDAIAEKVGVSADERAVAGAVDAILPAPPGAGSAGDPVADGLAGEGPLGGHAQ